MTIKELKKIIENIPDDTEVYIDYSYSFGYGWDRNEEVEAPIAETQFLDWASIHTPSEFHLSTYEKEK